MWDFHFVLDAFIYINWGLDANSITDEFLGFEEGMHHNVTIAENNTIYEEHDWYVLLFQLNLDKHPNILNRIWIFC